MYVLTVSYASLSTYYHDHLICDKCQVSEETIVLRQWESKILSKQLIKVELLPWKISKADTSSVSPNFQLIYACHPKLVEKTSESRAVPGAFIHSNSRSSTGETTVNLLGRHCRVYGFISLDIGRLGWKQKKKQTTGWKITQTNKHLYVGVLNQTVWFSTLTGVWHKPPCKAIS